MERKVLQIEKNGKKVDMMPIMDDLSIYTNGMTLKEQIDNIRRAIRVGELFLGAYETEEKLLEKYPNGSDLVAGTYALVTDVDAFYIYDVETLTWKASLFSSNGIYQLNGLTGTNGVLTITGGDIQATVPSANVVDQTISQHLEYLASSNKDLQEAAYNVPVLTGEMVKESNAYVIKISADADLKGKLTSATLSFYITTTSGETYNGNLPMKYRLYYSDGTNEEGIITGKYARTTSDQLTRNQFKADAYSWHSVLFNGKACSFLDLGKNELTIRKYNFGSWSTRAEGGYYTQVKLYGVYDLNVVGFVKKNGNVRTSAVLDYEYTLGGEQVTINIYSDEQIDGEVLIAW